MATSSSTLKPLLILPSSHSTLSSKSPKPSTTHFPSNISTLPSLKSKPSKGFASPELLDTLETLDDSTEPLDRASLEAYKVAAGSEIHGTPKISIEDDCIDKPRTCNFVKSPPFGPASSNCATAIDVQTMLLNAYLSLGRSQVEESCKLTKDAAKTSNTKTMCPVYLPTKKGIYCVLKSPQGHKDARFHFEIRTHQRLIDILYPTEQTLESLKIRVSSCSQAIFYMSHFFILLKLASLEGSSLQSMRTRAHSLQKLARDGVLSSCVYVNWETRIHVDKIKATDLDRISEIEFGKQTKLTVGESSV
ncbi:hypothetical protein C5167_044309 [Papaver somniferum]|uniref:Small ribosomal subunit protein uS10 domain-containing protein n=1 Tax=Papaver somniferum TaxID=3469 RepID=A0A4Y7LAM8_PAPSO|nr:hypothetical protein C5167_044309 [Papaver somniferum]